jgi:hypothetical protein
MTSRLYRELFSYWVVSLGVAVATGGCLTELDEPIEVSEVESNIVVDNGISLNGISSNGISSNGISSSGMNLHSISRSGMTLNGASLSGVSVTGTQLQGYRWGSKLTGAALVGTRMKGQLLGGGQVDLRIDASALLAAPNTDVRTYAISYATTTGTWSPLCAGANEAILFPGTWNATTVRHQNDDNLFSVSCRGATFAKCTELGYKGDSLLDTYHQACIRALRADYCGDGQSHTVTGTRINVYDKLGRQIDTESWTLEALWTPSGATCINQGRVAVVLTTPTVPECVASRARVACPATGWPPGMLIRTEISR